MAQKAIVVNARMLRQNRLDGTGWFAYQTLRRITAAHPEIHFIFLFDRPFASEFIFGPNVSGQVVFPPIRHGLLYYPWYQLRVKHILRTLKPEVFLSPDGLIAIGSACPQIAVIHDIGFHHTPQDLPWWTRQYFCRYYRRAAETATRVVTVSEYSKNDMIASYHIDPSRVAVVYNGVQENFRPASAMAVQETRQKFAQGQPYFLFIGSIHPRKNIVRLLQAFALFKSATHSPLKLILAGAFFWGKKEIERTLEALPCRDDIIFTGRVDDDTLSRLTAGASALTYIPLFEGFGVPLIEAMACDIPIISSDCSALPEIAGTAALYVDPLNVPSIAQAMERIITDTALRALLIAEGQKQRTKFSWDASAEQLWNVIQAVLSIMT